MQRSSGEVCCKKVDMRNLNVADGSLHNGQIQF